MLGDTRGLPTKLIAGSSGEITDDSLFRLPENLIQLERPLNFKYAFFNCSEQIMGISHY